MEEIRVMKNAEKTVDGFRFLPPSLAAWIQAFVPDEDFRGPIPWTPLPRSMNEMTFSLVSSAGISLKSDPPFDMEREKRNPHGETPLFGQFWTKSRRPGRRKSRWGNSFHML
jgi:hypothetical protein